MTLACVLKGKAGGEHITVSYFEILLLAVDYNVRSTADNVIQPCIHGRNHVAVPGVARGDCMTGFKDVYDDIVYIIVQNMVLILYHRKDHRLSQVNGLLKYP